MPDISILDVGHGNSSVIRDGEMVLIVDAGPGTALLEYLSGDRYIGDFYGNGFSC